MRAVSFPRHPASIYEHSECIVLAGGASGGGHVGGLLARRRASIFPHTKRKNEMNPPSGSHETTRQKGQKTKKQNKKCTTLNLTVAQSADRPC
jgi:hypothetical protein